MAAFSTDPEEMIVEAPNGLRVTFPKGTSEAIINSVMAAAYKESLGGPSMPTATPASGGQKDPRSMKFRLLQDGPTDPHDMKFKIAGAGGMLGTQPATPATMGQLETALRNADKAGDVPAAKQLARAIIAMRQGQATAAQSPAQPSPAPTPQPSPQPATEPASEFERFQAMMEDRARAGNPVPLNGTNSTLNDMGRQFQRGLVQGAGALLSFPADAGDWLGSQAIRGLSYVTGGDPEQAVKDTLAARNRHTSLPTPQDVGHAISGSADYVGDAQTTPGSFANTIGQFLPSIFAGKPTPRTIIGPGASLTPLATSTTTAAVGSEAAGQASEGTGAEPYARLAGALLGAVTPSAAARAVSPNAITGSRRELVDALTREGVSTTAGQKTGRNFLRNVESELGGGKAAGLMDEQARQFTKAAARKAGIDADRLTPPVMDRAFAGIGKEFDTLAANTRLPLDGRLQDDMLNAVADYQAVAAAPAGAAEEVMNRIATLAGKNGGVLDGEAYAQVSSLIARYQRASGADPALREALGGIREAMDSAIERSLSGDLLSRWRDVRGRYRNMLAIEKALLSSGAATAEGLLSPSALRNAVAQKQGARGYVTGKGDLAGLARAGEAILKPLPDSGTAGRTAARNLGAGLLTAAGAAAGAAGGNPLMAIAGALAGSAAPYAAGRALLSKPVQAYLANQLVSGGRKSSAILRALTAAQGARASEAWQGY